MEDDEVVVGLGGQDAGEDVLILYHGVLRSMNIINITYFQFIGVTIFVMNSFHKYFNCTSDLQMPKVVDNYVFERKIGSGQYGDVFKGYNKNNGMDIAIKAIKR